MVKRLKVGLIYSYNKNWVAGTYYILNLIHALNEQEDQKKPELIILTYSEADFETLKATSYPHLIFHQLRGEDFEPSYNIAERAVNKIFRIISGNNLINKKHTKKRLSVKLDVLFPASNHIYFSSVKNRLFWIPDFQEHFLPHFFSQEEIKSRKEYQKKLSDDGEAIVFSSDDAASHFKSIYPGSQARTFVLPFAVTHPKYDTITTDTLFKKYSIDKPYFFCPNQVWAHKNHKVVLNALKILKEKDNKNMLVLFSGKEHDNRNPHFFNQLKIYISENQIEENVRFLGFIDREDQLQLMKNAICVIQPSLFEGWSTVVEDVKAIGQYAIVSDLPVHREQIKENATFFDPKNAEQLATYLNDFMEQPPSKIKTDYKQNITKFGERFIEIVNKVVS